MKAFFIAGTHSGCGKTTVTLGVMAALLKRGFTVQAFKVGPDFIDTGHHRRITGKDAHNLDGWMLSRQANQEIFSRYSRSMDIAVIEGVMGLYDGISGSDESGSTAQMAKWLDLPVILIIDATSMARSAAATALGFFRFDPELSLLGIIFNRVGSKVHEEMLRDAMSSIIPDLPVFGYLHRDNDLEMPSRHLGLVTDEELCIGKDLIEKLANWIDTSVNLDHLLECIKEIELDGVYTAPISRPKIKIGIAQDKAFSFYYPENLRLLKEAGAELIPFSPLRDNQLPKGIKGLYLGGGYPELYCNELAENKDLLQEIKEFGLDGGGPIYGECGGFMFLMKEIRDLSGKAYPMVGIFNTTAIMDNHLRALGYREIVTKKGSVLGPKGTRVRGHEFHYSHIQDRDIREERIYSMADRKHFSYDNEGFVRKGVLGSYVHLHWGSNPGVAKNFVDYCRNYGS
jgi:cobyrinic acid a,c-diamide synthase